MSVKESPIARLYEQISSTVGPITLEVIRLLPDSLVLGTAILAGISMCKSYGVLLFTMLEIMFGQRIFSMIIGSISPIGATTEAMQGACLSGFSYPNSMRISLLEKIGVPSMFPSPTMFFLSSVMTYMISAMQNFGRELKALSGDIQLRTTIASVMSILFMLIMFIFRYHYGCETFGSLLLSLFLGSIFGFALVQQNITLFGRDGVNVLNIPMIQSSLEQGKPMYVCAPSNI
jgi:hypothetical protein